MLALLAIPLAAQQGRGSIQGTVADSSGAAIAGANVTVLNIETNSTFVAQTNTDGFYTAPTLPVGSYTVTAEKQGFKRSVRSGITLLVDQRAQVDLTVEIGAVAESIEVRSEAPLVDTGSATLGKVIENRRVLELPLKRRNALALTLLTPGVKSNAGPTNSGFGDRGIQLSSISINGGPNSMNGMVLDGGNNIQSYIGEVAINPGVDAVEEFKVQSGAMSVRVWIHRRRSSQRCDEIRHEQPSWFSIRILAEREARCAKLIRRSQAAFRYNQYGVAVGGRIIRDRTFFFGNWEQYNYRKSDPKITSFPTVSQRGGDFSDFFDTSGKLIPIYDPATTRANPNGAGVIRDQFPGNRIPASRLDPVALKIQDFYPIPNRTPLIDSPMRTTTSNLAARSATCASTP